MKAAATGSPVRPQSPGRGRWWHRLWHWLILAVCGAGAVIAGRMAVALWRSGQDEAASGSPLMLWGLSAACAVFVLVFLAEGWVRIRALRRRPSPAPGAGP